LRASKPIGLDRNAKEQNGLENAKFPSPNPGAVTGRLRLHLESHSLLTSSASIAPARDIYAKTSFLLARTQTLDLTTLAHYETGVLMKANVVGRPGLMSFSATTSAQDETSSGGGGIALNIAGRKESRASSSPIGEPPIEAAAALGQHAYVDARL